MTGPRRNGKSTGIWRMASLAAAIGLVIAFASPPALNAATTERLVVDWRSGLAIHGFDPVAYFTDNRPVVGRPEVEYAFAGAVWRFRNVGNRAAFDARPDVYLPRFGGYDPVAVARGVATPGHPLLWLVAHERLYLFQSAQTRDAFAADMDNAIQAADLKWPDVWRELVP